MLSGFKISWPVGVLTGSAWRLPDVID